MRHILLAMTALTLPASALLAQDAAQARRAGG